MVIRITFFCIDDREQMKNELKNLRYRVVYIKQSIDGRSISAFTYKIHMKAIKKRFMLHLLYLFVNKRLFTCHYHHINHNLDTQ